MTTAETMQIMAKQIKGHLPKGFGFTLLVYPFSRPGITNYISNGERSDMITALRETADRLEKKQDFQTPRGN